MVDNDRISCSYKIPSYKLEMELAFLKANSAPFFLLWIGWLGGIVLLPHFHLWILMHSYCHVNADSSFGTKYWLGFVHKLAFCPVGPVGSNMSRVTIFKKSILPC